MLSMILLGTDIEGMGSYGSVLNLLLRFTFFFNGRRGRFRKVKEVEVNFKASKYLHAAERLRGNDWRYLP